MNEPSRTRRGFFRALAGADPRSPKAFSLTAFYAARKTEGLASPASLPAFARLETDGVATATIGTPNLGPRKG